MANAFIPWIGGKRRLARHLLPLIPTHTCYCEPFAGAAAIFFAKPPSQVEVLNDVNGELVNLFRVIQHHLEEFCRQFKHALLSRQIYEWEQMKRPETLTDVQRAARFYYLQKLAFGGKVTGQSFGTGSTVGIRINLLRIEEELSAAHVRLAGVIVEHLDWQDCLARYDASHTFFYADPPYWETEGYGVDFGLEQYQALAAAARSIAGKLIISVNDHPKMREVFAGLPMEAVRITYTVSRGGGAAREELIIRSSEEGFGGTRSLL